MGTKSLTRYDVDLSPKLNKGEFRVIFSWGATPRDMDIWMSTPDPSCTVGFRQKTCKSQFTVFQKTFKIGVDGQIVAGARYPKPNKRDSSYAPLPLWTNATSDCRPYTPRSGNACVQDSIWSVFA